MSEMSVGKPRGEKRSSLFRVLSVVLVALVLGVFVDFVILSILFARRPTPRGQVYIIRCKTNLHCMSTAMGFYAADISDMLPSGNTWCDALSKYVMRENFICPGSDAKQGQSSYAMNKYVAGKKLADLSPDLVLLFESTPRWNQCGGPELLVTENHDGEGCNVLFVDGHVEFVKASRIWQLKWTDQSSDREGDAAQKVRNARRSGSDQDWRYWLENVVSYHRFTREEITAATGLGNDEISAGLKRFDIRLDNRPQRQEAGTLLVLPYPGGRHPRIGFLEGAIDPQRETKFSVFTPWDPNSYVVVDMPEAIWSNLGLTYLAHTHIDTIWTKQGVVLPKLEWNRRSNGSLDIERELPNGIAFGAKVIPRREAVHMELWLKNGTNERLTDLRVQICVLPKMASGFEQQTDDNKIFTNPYVACRSSDGKNWIITAWENCHRPWGNERCPCFHSDPKFPDLEPGQTHRLQGWLSFYQGTDIEAEFERIEKTGWRKQP